MIFKINNKLVCYNATPKCGCTTTKAMLMEASTDQDLNISTEKELQLLRIMQEGLSNIRKHADASRIWIDLMVAESQLQLQIRDDGRGFDPQAAFGDDLPDHYGLDSMRERAEAIGASFVLDSQVGNGTKILVKLELNGR